MPEETQTPFSQQIAHMAKGTLDLELTTELAALVTSIMNHRKKGTLTLTLDLKPELNSAAEVTMVVITPKVQSKHPQPGRISSRMWPTRDGDLLRHDPDQSELDLKTVDTTTGEIKEL